LLTHLYTYLKEVTGSFLELICGLSKHHPKFGFR